MSNKHDFKERPIFTQELWDSFDWKVLMCGMGDDTVMLIAELYERGFEPDELVFCDTGSEFPHTYDFIEFLKSWSEEKKWSKVVILRKIDKHKNPLSVISMTRSQSTLPNAAFGGRSCSHRFKKETADLYFNNSHNCWKAWGVEKKGSRINTHTAKILRMIGINFDEPNRVKGWIPENKWVQVHPLYDLEIGEKESEAVSRVGLYYPGKSSCYICPFLTHGEVAMLRKDYPHLYKEGLDQEDEYRKKHLIESAQYDIFGDVVYDNTVMGLGGQNGKTWPQMMQEYDASPKSYKYSTNKKPCDCGH